MRKYVEANRIAYNQLAKHYSDRRKNKSEFEEEPSELVDFFVKVFSTEMSNVQVLEIGPGGGSILREFNNYNALTTAIDVSDKIVESCKFVAPNTNYIINDVLDVKIASATFDIIYLGAIIHLFPKLDAIELMRKVNFWLKTDGYIFVNTTVSNNSEEGYFEKDDTENKVQRFRKKWTEEEFLIFIEMSGFEIIERKYTFERDRNKQWLGLYCKKLKDFTYTDNVKFDADTLAVLNRKIKINNEIIDFEVVCRNKVVLIIPILEDGTVILLSQFRSAIGKYIYEFPAGKMTAADADSIEAAKRELREETGYTAKKIIRLFQFYTAPHFTDEQVEIFLAEDMVAGRSYSDEKEFINIKKCSISTLSNIINFEDAKSLIATQVLKRFLYVKKHL